MNLVFMFIVAFECYLAAMVFARGDDEEVSVWIKLVIRLSNFHMVIMDRMEVSVSSRGNSNKVDKSTMKTSDVSGADATVYPFRKTL